MTVVGGGKSYMVAFLHSQSDSAKNPARHTVSFGSRGPEINI
jgi:hypothetical protein